MKKVSYLETLCELSRLSKRRVRANGSVGAVSPETGILIALVALAALLSIDTIGDRLNICFFSMSACHLQNDLPGCQFGSCRFAWLSGDGHAAALMRRTACNSANDAWFFNSVRVSCY